MDDLATLLDRSAAGSFRDPLGRLVDTGERILRLVYPEGEADLQAFLNSPVAGKLVETGRLVGTRIHPDKPADQTAGTVLEHDRVPFPSYPHEWPAEMLHAAGMLTLEVGLEALHGGFGLKDATPHNVLFRGPEPVFVDLLSFERRLPQDPTWRPYDQFLRTFVRPLAVNSHFGLPLQDIFLSHHDGLTPEFVYRLCGVTKRLTPPFLSLASLPTWLGRMQTADRPQTYATRTSPSAEQAHFVLETLLKHLRRWLGRVKPPIASSDWSSYMTASQAISYEAEAFKAKEAFIAEFLRDHRPSRVLDIGCNTGHFSAMAARQGARVVALDADQTVVGQVWQSARAENLDILPLVVNICRPSPGTGWRNRECRPFLSRASGTFDTVWMLAVIHHMLVTERVPLAEIVDLTAELTTGWAVIEFVNPDDPMFQRLARGREHLHRDLTPELFEAVIQTRFELIRKQVLAPGHRCLYLLRKKALGA